MRPQLRQSFPSLRSVAPATICVADDLLPCCSFRLNEGGQLLIEQPLWVQGCLTLSTKCPPLLHPYRVWISILNLIPAHLIGCHRSYHPAMPATVPDPDKPAKVIGARVQDLRAPLPPRSRQDAARHIHACCSCRWIPLGHIDAPTHDAYSRRSALGPAAC